ncbi:MAG: cation-translocating P-type ATPase [Planctomycetes bacterium]|nr:cation-translocating P-type ATPase [Planctomycetota bacterium]MBL7144694.1 cation-translocating P-type ATPase [Phycisphaerae bacterium]
MINGKSGSQHTAGIAAPWACKSEEILEQYQVVREEGLDKRRIKSLLKKYGPNRLREAKKKSMAKILLNQVKSLIVILLAIAAILSCVFQEWMDGLAIAGVIFINTAIGFFMELKAVRSMEALHRMERVTARVRRSGQVREVHARQLVPGDIVLLEGGDIVSVDMRVVIAGKLQADESVLTGESLPVSKQTEEIDSSASLGDRTNMLYKGTSITRGSGEAVVTATGMETELGKITDLVQKAEDEVTPLEKRLDLLGRKLLLVTLLFIAVIAGTGIARGKEVIQMIETAIALAVAAIPEGLPIVATLALARGMIRMARRNAMVNHLAAVETLGGVSVICTDKTGTLTENKMTITDFILSDQHVKIGRFDDQGRAEFSVDGQNIDPRQNDRLIKTLQIGVLCNNASLDKKKTDSTAGVGDPLEVAFLVAAQKASIDYEELNKEYPEEREDAFDSDTKKMATFNRHNNNYLVAVKGAAEAILEDAAWVATQNGREQMEDKWREFWLQQNSELAEQGYRVLALAMKETESIEFEPYSDLTFLGLACMEDPAREDVRQAITACRNAGIQTVMITGDHPKTAANIASSIGLTESGRDNVIVGKDIKAYETMSQADKETYQQTPVFARVSPKQKLDIVAVHQQAGAVVAMTGDGVNDAPALKKADIGIAMGLRGTQVAQEAADMVLKDDAFSTIVVAVEQGRIIFQNIRKFVIYLLSCNISEVMIVFAASVVNAPLPILPLQILFLNLVTDVFPALALGVGRGNPGIMQAKPRSSNEPILPRSCWFSILGYGISITFSVLLSFWLAFRMLKMDHNQAVTVSFLTIAFAQLWHIFNMRAKSTSLLKNDVTGNPYVWAALGLCTTLLILVVYQPFMARILKLANPGLAGWLLVLATSSMTCLIGQLLKLWNK